METSTKKSMFQNIALTFSGGGYRAATFGLGILSYFNQVKYGRKSLLEKVSGISTVSGGTITGAYYAYAMAKDKSFQNFYDHLHQLFEEDKLLELALKKFANDSLWNNTHKKRTLINSFALAYEELICKGSFKDIKDKKSHLKDICFNATDFSYGLAFRFQTSGVFGNYRLNNSDLKTLSSKFKIADAIASSSCFPLGFEPLILPDDYISNQNLKAFKNLKLDERFSNGVGIMDGGIVDNQGIGSIMNADKRRRSNKFDLIMVCDVGSYMMDPWLPSDINVKKVSRKLSPKSIYDWIVGLVKSLWWLVLPLPISIGLFLLCYFEVLDKWILIPAWLIAIFGSLSLIAHIAILYSKRYAIKIWSKLMSLLPDFLKGKLKYFKRLRLRLIARMLEERATSGKKMISEIFLKQIRRLNYDLFYKDENLKNRRSCATIYELTKDQYKDQKSDEIYTENDRKGINPPSESIFKAAQIATEMGTTLWFTQADRDVERLKNLIACGQFTACYNLLRFCLDLKEASDFEDTEHLDEMIAVFEADWDKFRNEPFWLYDLLLPKTISLL